MDLPVSEFKTVFVDLTEELTPQQYIQRLLRKKDCEDSFYVVDLGRLIHLYDKWMKELPDVLPFYAVKCNDDPALVRTLAALGTGFDCASQNEIKLVLGMGVDPERIVYANPCKQISHLKYAVSCGVLMMTFDSEAEVHKMKEHASQAKLLLRVSADDPLGDYSFGLKFGCSVETGKKLLLLCRKLCLQVIGVCFHVGTMGENPSAYRGAMATCVELFRYGAEVGYEFTILDIGGGYPGKKDSGSLFVEMAESVKQAWDEHFDPCVYPRLKIIAEPGNYFACSTHTLAVNIIGKRVLDSESGTKTFMYHINDGVFGSFNGVISYNMLFSLPTCQSTNDSYIQQPYGVRH